LHVYFTEQDVPSLKKYYTKEINYHDKGFLSPDAAASLARDFRKTLRNYSCRIENITFSSDDNIFYEIACDVIYSFTGDTGATEKKKITYNFELKKILNGYQIFQEDSR